MTLHDKFSLGFACIILFFIGAPLGTIIRKGDIQVMSAGTGITHSEFNSNEDHAVKVLQIWLFPNKKNVTPRYDQLSLQNIKVKNEFYQILSPNQNDQGVWIYQNSWFSLAEFDYDKEVNYNLNLTSNGVYIFVIEGQIKVGKESLEKRDGFGIWNTENINISALKGTKILLMEVPMSV